MQVLFIHGMGRSPLSGWPMLRHLRRAGLRTTTFGYATAFESFGSIQRRLDATLEKMSAGNESYVVIGHSLGGILARAALNSLPANVRQPHHVFLLGSPTQPARLAIRLKNNPLYRLLTGDCGQLLASSTRMLEIGALRVPTTSVAGVRGIPLGGGHFGNEPNDGVVSLSEVNAPWASKQIQLPVIHTLLPASGNVAAAILRELASNAH